jgi:hypothetical protein
MTDFPAVARFPRPRGFIDWRPSAKSGSLLDQVEAVLASYAGQLPLTLRQIFYRLVARFAYEKTERAYKRLGELLNSARRAGRVPMDHIRDDGFVRHAPNAFASVDAFLEAVRAAAEDLRLDRQRGQKRRLVVMCEAAGMAPQLARIADPYGVEVLSSGGFSSLTDTHGLAAQWARQAITVLQIGDHDPSGVHVFSHLAEDVAAFAEAYGGNTEFIRLAVTLDQAHALGLASAPPKATDRRAFAGDETHQAEAIDPADLAQIVENAITARLDRAAYDAVLQAEIAAREAVLSRLDLQ